MDAGAENFPLLTPPLLIPTGEVLMQPLDLQPPRYGGAMTNRRISGCEMMRDDEHEKHGQFR
ncbi:hypothetical protein HanRHA438_Chr10g0432091 [Helianthus annuus]|nr:hypothetical protein HanRHA438_Chr17g0838321 [Helianthus annuus]KAJ0877761.1 hypothetical protein HanRHA438_Chr10g0432091 [Helianthus annuus]